MSETQYKTNAADILRKELEDLRSERDRLRIIIDTKGKKERLAAQKRLGEMNWQIPNVLAQISLLKTTTVDTTGDNAARLRSEIDSVDREFQMQTAALSSGTYPANAIDAGIRMQSALLARREALKQELERTSSSKVSQANDDREANVAQVIAWGIEEAKQKELEMSLPPGAAKTAAAKAAAIATTKKAYFNRIINERFKDAPNHDYAGWTANIPTPRDYTTEGKSSQGVWDSGEIREKGVVVSIPPFTVANIPDSIYANKVPFKYSSTPIKAVKVKAPVNVYAPLPSITVKK